MADPKQEKNPWTCLSKTPVYRNNWIEVEHHNVLTPTGTKGIYGLVKFRHLAVGIVPVDERGEVTMVGQYRYTTDEYSWEIPAGGAEPGESAEIAARRELREETGLRTEMLVRLCELQLSNSVTNERGIIFLATGLTRGENSPDETEQLRLQTLPLEAAISQIFSGHLTDSLTVSGLLAASYFLATKNSPEQK